jgi:hypothetical protein
MARCGGLWNGNVTGVAAISVVALWPLVGGPPNKRMKLSWRGGRLKGKGSALMAAAAPRSLCAIR